MKARSSGFRSIASKNIVNILKVPNILRNVAIQNVNKAFVHITDEPPLKFAKKMAEGKKYEL